MEIKIHVLWHENAGFHLWGEKTKISTHKDSCDQTKNPNQHPFAATYHDVLTNFTTLTQGAVKFIKKGNIHLLLPTDTLENIPIRSTTMHNAGEQARYETHWWSAEACIIKPDQIINFLTHKSTLSPHKKINCTFGDSYYYWRDALKFCFRILANQSILPGVKGIITDSLTRYEACWDLTLFDYEEVQLTQLINAMPLSCVYCSSHDPKDQTILPSQSDLFHNFLQTAIQIFSTSMTKTKKHSNKSNHQQESLCEYWATKFMTDNPVLEGPTSPWESFMKKLEPWKKRSAFYQNSRKMELKTTLTVQEQSAESQQQEKPWRMHLGLTSTNNSPFAGSASMLYEKNSHDYIMATTIFDNPQRIMRAHCAILAHHNPTFKTLVNDLKPTHVDLSDTELVHFLEKDIPTLEATQRFAITMPSWLTNLQDRLQLQLHLKESRNPHEFFNVGNLLDYDWKIALGNQILSVQEFEKIVESKRQFIKRNNEWLLLHPVQTKKIVSFLREHTTQRIPVVQALKLGLGQNSFDHNEVEVTDIVGDEWATHFLETIHKPERLPLIPIPPSFQGKLRPYQLVGVSWLAFLETLGLGACLADDMGLGKTVQLIAWILYRKRNKNSTSAKILLICPMSILNNWYREFERFAPSLKILIHHGIQRATDTTFQEMLQAYDVVVSTYALAVRDYDLFSSVTWDALILDEAQNIKNHSAKKTQSLKKIVAGYRIALTGTPLENRLIELWSIIDFLNNNYLGSYKHFTEHFARPIELYQDQQLTSSLKRLVAPCILRRVKSDTSIIKDLPEKIETKVFCNLTQEQATLYQAAVDTMLAQIKVASGIERAGLIFSTMLTLKQICNHPAHYLKEPSCTAPRSGKLVRLQELLEEVLAAGDKALIFTQFAQMGLLLTPFLETQLNYRVLFLHGETNKKNRDAMVDDFQDKHSTARVFVLSLKAGGTGLNLTQANHVFHFDRWWNPAVEDQATDRAFRIGQKRMVQVHKFICMGTLEEKIDALIEKKKMLSSSIIGNGEQWISQLSNQQLTELLVLDKNTIDTE